MDKLWAPWRGEFVSNINDGDACFICRVVSEIGRDAENYVVERTCMSLALLNRYPYNTGHILVVPNRHVAEFNLLSNDEIIDMMRLLDRMTQKLRHAMRPHGFNMGVNIGRAAGAGVEGHLHFHIVPRWQGDTNFMTVLAETKVLPHDLETIFKLLSKPI